MRKGLSNSYPNCSFAYLFDVTNVVVLKLVALAS